MKCDSSTVAITNVRLKELADWREAIFIDMETTSQNALGSVVLQRPVEIYPTYLGDLRFVYDPVRSSYRLPQVRNKSYTKQDTMSSASDAIVYFTNAAVVFHENFAKNVGFVTRMYRFPDLDNGAIHAAHVQLNKAYEQRKSHRVNSRYNPRYEIGDIATVQYTASGTRKAFDVDVIIESISEITIGPGKNSMTVQGREKVSRTVYP
jgi:hypothetical protein